MGKLRTSNLIVMDIGRQRVTAVDVNISRQGVRVVTMCSVDVPPDVDTSDDEWFGRWIGRTLEEHKFGNHPVVCTIPRHLVGMKRLLLPSDDPGELPGMVRLELVDQLPFTDGESVMDYAILGDRDKQTEVIAAAVRQVVVDRYQALAKEMGRKFAGLSLRPLATAALIADRASDVSGALLALDLREHGSMEVVIEWGGRIRFARAAEVLEIDQLGDHHAQAERLATEARRSWMSYRVTEDSPDVARVIVIGADGVAGGVAEEVRRELKRPTEVLLSRAEVTGETAELEAAWPLVGVALERFEGRDSINFLSPKQPPDIAARRRVRWLGAAAALVIFGLFGWQVTHDQLSQLDERIEELETRQRELFPAYARLHRQRRQLEHLDRWTDAEFVWLDHLTYITDALPTPSDAILGSLVATMGDPRISFDRNRKTWQDVISLASIQMAGVARNRVIADQIRGALVDNELYQAMPVGSDASVRSDAYPEAFSIRIITDRRSPYVDEGNDPSRADAGRERATVADADDSVDGGGS